jgi:FMN phosphatase YigB (HAD superfamily)
MLHFNRFEILTFDCYGTLIDWETGILAALHRILSAHKKKIDNASVLKLYGDFEQRSEQARFDRIAKSSNQSSASLAPSFASLPPPKKCTRCQTLSLAGSPGPIPSPPFA